MGYISDNSEDYQGQPVDLTPVGTPAPAAPPAQAPTYVSENSQPQAPAAPSYVSENSQPAQASAGLQIPAPPVPEQPTYVADNSEPAQVSVGRQPSPQNPLQQAANYAIDTERRGLENWQQAAKDVQRGDYGSAAGNVLAPAGRLINDSITATYAPGNLWRQGTGAALDLAGRPQENSGLDLNPLSLLGNPTNTSTLQLGMDIGRQFLQDPAKNLSNLGQLPDRLGQAWNNAQDFRYFKSTGQSADIPVNIGGFTADIPYGRASEFVTEEALNPQNYLGFGLGAQLPGRVGRVAGAIDEASMLPYTAASKLFGNTTVGGLATLGGLGVVAAPAIFSNVKDKDGNPVFGDNPITSGSWMQNIPEDLRPAAGLLVPIGAGLAAAALWRGGGRLAGVLPKTTVMATAGTIVRDVAGKAPEVVPGAKLNQSGTIVDTFGQPVRGARLAVEGEPISAARTLTTPTKTAVGNLARNDFNSTMNYVSALADGDQVRANGLLTNVMREIMRDPNATPDTLARAAAAVTDPTKAPLAIPREVFQMPEVRKTLSGLRRTLVNGAGIEPGPGMDAKIADFFNAFMDQNGGDMALVQNKLEGAYLSQLQRDLGYANPDWASPIRRYASVLDDLELNPNAKAALQQHMRQPILLERGSDVFNQIVDAMDNRETGRARTLASQAIADIKQAAAKIQPDAQGRRPIMPNALNDKLVGANINPFMDLMMGSKAIISPFWLSGAPRYFVNNFLSDMLMLTTGTQGRGWHWALNPDAGDLALANRGHGALHPWLTGESFTNEVLGTGVQGGLPRQRGAVRIAFDRLGDTVPGGTAIENVVTAPAKGARWVGEQIQKLPLMSETARRKAIYVAQYVQRYDDELYKAARSVLDGSGMDARAADAAAKRIVRSVSSGAPMNHWSAGVDFGTMPTALRGQAEMMARQANSPQEFLTNWQRFLDDRRGENLTLRNAMNPGDVFGPRTADAFGGDTLAARQERLGALDPNAVQPDVPLQRQPVNPATGRSIQDELRSRFGPEVDAAAPGPRPTPVDVVPITPGVRSGAPNARPYQQYYDDLLTVARQIAPDEKIARQQADAVWAVENARAWEWARRTGKTADEYFATKAPKVTFENRRVTTAQPGNIEQATALTVKGEYDRAARIITAYQQADVTTLIHETTHAFVDTMTADAKLYSSELDTMGRWLKAQGLQPDYKRWGTPELEAIARGFERYTAEGIGVPSTLAKVFDKLKAFFLDVYKSLKGSEIDVPVTSELRGAFRTSMGSERFSVQETRQTLDVLSKMLSETDNAAIDVFGGNQRQTYRDLAGQLNQLQGKKSNPDGLPYALRAISDRLQEVAGATVDGKVVPVDRLPGAYDQWLTAAPQRAENLARWAESYRTFLEEYAVVPLPYAEKARTRNTKAGPVGSMRAVGNRDYAVVRIGDAAQLTDALKGGKDAYAEAVNRLRVDHTDVVPADAATVATTPVRRAAQTEAAPAKVRLTHGTIEEQQRQIEIGRRAIAQDQARLDSGVKDLDNQIRNRIIGRQYEVSKLERELSGNLTDVEARNQAARAARFGTGDRLAVTLPDGTEAQGVYWSSPYGKVRVKLDDGSFVMAERDAVRKVDAPGRLRQTGDPTSLFQTAREDLFPDQQPQDVRAKLDDAGAAMATPTLDVAAATQALDDAFAALPPYLKNQPAMMQDVVSAIRSGRKVTGLPGQVEQSARRLADALDAVDNANRAAQQARDAAFQKGGLAQNISDDVAREALRTIPDIADPGWKLADGTPYTGPVNRTATGYVTPDGQALTFTNTMEWAADGVPPMTDILDRMYAKAAMDAQAAVQAGMANATLPANVSNVIDFQKMRELKNRANINAQQGALTDTRGLLFGYDDRSYGQYLIDHWSPFAYWTISHTAQAAKYLAKHPGQYFTLMEVMADWAKQTENESPGNRWTVRLFQTPDGTEFRFRPTALLPFATQGIADIVNLATGDARGNAVKELMQAFGMSPHFPIDLAMQAATTRGAGAATEWWTGPQAENRASDLLPQAQLLRRLTNGNVDIEGGNIFGVQFPSLRESVYGTNRLGVDDYYTGLELARRVNDGQITEVQAKQAALSVRDGNPDALWMDAQGQAQGDQGKYALMRYFGLPLAVKPNERMRLEDLNAQYFGQQGGLPAPGVRLTQERRDFLQQNPDLTTAWAMNDPAAQLRNDIATSQWYDEQSKLYGGYQAERMKLSDLVTSGQIDVKTYNDRMDVLKQQFDQQLTELESGKPAGYSEPGTQENPNAPSRPRYVAPDAPLYQAVSDAKAAIRALPYDENNKQAYFDARDRIIDAMPPDARAMYLNEQQTRDLANETPYERDLRTRIYPLQDQYYALPYYAAGSEADHQRWDRAKQVYEDARYADGGTTAKGRAALAAAGIPYADYAEAMDNRSDARKQFLATPEGRQLQQYWDSKRGETEQTAASQPATTTRTSSFTTRTSSGAYVAPRSSQGYSGSSRATGSQTARQERAALFDSQPQDQGPTVYYQWLQENGARLNELNAQLGIDKRYLDGDRARAMAERSAMLDTYGQLKDRGLTREASAYYAQNKDRMDALKAYADGKSMRYPGEQGMVSRNSAPAGTVAAQQPRVAGNGAPQTEYIRLLFDDPTLVPTLRQAWAGNQRVITPAFQQQMAQDFARHPLGAQTMGEWLSYIEMMQPRRVA